MNTVKDEQVDEAIEQRATTWFVRHREGELTPAEQKQYMQWLRASPRHVEAYLNLIGLTSKLPEAISGLGIDVEALARKISQSRATAEQALFANTAVPVRKESAQRHGRRIALAAAVLVAIATTMAGGLYWSGAQWLAQSIVVPQSQQRMLTLADGSTAHLNSNTRIKVRYSRTQRLIELPEGQALFDVAHDARRPFIVRSGRMDVVAVGTQFDVYRRAEHTQITVVEGRVAVLSPHNPGTGIREDTKEGPAARVGQRDTAQLAARSSDKRANMAESEVLLTAGEQVKIADHSRLTKPVRVDVQLATAWSRNEVSFAAARLEDVAAQFNRNTGARISIEDARLRDYRISGVFQAYDVDSFVAYLGQFEGIAVERHGDRVRVHEGNGNLSKTR